MTKAEADRMAQEVQRTPGWQIVGFYSLDALSKNATAHGVYALHQRTKTVQQIFNRSAWMAMKTKYRA